MNTSLLAATNAKPGAPTEAHAELARLAERILEIPGRDTPALEIHPAGCQVAITWRGPEHRFRLELSDHACARADWRAVAEPVRYAGGIHRVLLPGATHVRYVRLVRNPPAPVRRVSAPRPPAARCRQRDSEPAAEPGPLSVRTEGREALPMLLVVAVVAFLMVRHLAAGQ